jgi:hypothetical protein
MARTEDEIRQSLIESLQTVDESVDVVKGPVYNFLLKPVPVELQKTEADVERLTLLTTLQLGRVATEEEVEALATSFSIRLGGGRASRSSGQVFYTNSRPSLDVVVDRGVLVGTDDQRYTYFVSEAQTLPAATADNFYNAATRRYELVVKCEATAVGPDFDLPPGRITRLITNVTGIDGTINISQYTGGQEAEDLEASVDRIRAKLAGLDPETGGGIKSDIRNYDAENVTDVSLVYPKDRTLFKRAINRPAIDAYVLGSAIESYEQSYTATGGETTIMLEKLPALALNGVTVNGATVDATLIQDTSRETGYSARALDYVLLASSLSASDIVVLNYDYNDLIDAMQTDLFELERPFDTDVLARQPREVAVEVVVDASILPSGDEARTFTQIESKLFEKIETEYFQTALLPEVLRQQIQDEVAGINTLRFVRFRRTSGGLLDVETIALAKNETATIDQALLDIRVRK